MRGDFTRVTFDPAKHFSRVLMQQGRVQLDADWNEQNSILLHYLRTLVTDLIGPYAAPAQGGGFNIVTNPNDKRDFGISPGRMYVDGILVENDDPQASYLHQRYPQDPKALSTDGTYVVYLDVWERHVTALEDPDIREKALGGPDTATRTQVVWQVRTRNAETIRTDEGAPDLCRTVAQWPKLSDASMSARLEPSQRSTNPCIIAPASRYRGAANQLYRVEIHRGGKGRDPNAKTTAPDVATFKWSRDNGSIATAITDGGGTQFTVSQSRGFSPNAWIEFSNDEMDRQGRPGVLVKLTNVQDGTLTIDPDTNTQGADLSRMTRVRGWDEQAVGDIELADGAVVLTEGKWISLQDGIQVWFKPGGTYNAGDYWLIPARVATGQIEWPTQTGATGEVEPKPIPPQGVEHHYAPLAVIKLGGEAIEVAQTCRCVFSPNNSCM